jgi:hypothetical protein
MEGSKVKEGRVGESRLSWWISWYFKGDSHVRGELSELMIVRRGGRQSCRWLDVCLDYRVGSRRCRDMGKELRKQECCRASNFKLDFLRISGCIPRIAFR